MRHTTRRLGTAEVANFYQLYLISIRSGSANIKVFRNGKLRVNKVKKVRRARKRERVERSSKRELETKGKKRPFEEEEEEGIAFLKQVSFSIRSGKISIRLESHGVILNWDVVRDNLKVKVQAQRYLGRRRLCGLCGSIEDDNQDSGGAAQVTRNKRFEPVPPSLMAWVWSRGHACRERSRAAKEELKWLAKSDTSSVGPEIISFLNMAGSSSGRAAYSTPTNSPEHLSRTDEIVVKPLENKE